MKKSYTYFLQLFCIVFIATTTVDSYGKSGFIRSNNVLHELRSSFMKTLIDVDLDIKLERRNSEQPSILLCPASIVTVNVDSGTCGAVVNSILPSTDIVGGTIVLITSLGDGDIFPVGTTAVIYEERDASNIATGLTCSFDVIVTDNENPTASNPADINVQCATDVPVADISVVTDAADNCSTPIVAFVSDVSDGNSNPEIITRTYSVTDDSNNSINVTQTITIKDITIPTASNPSSVNVECTADIPAANINVVTDAADNCSTPMVAFVSEVSDGNSNPEIITRTYSVTDLAGNTINVSQQITIQDTTNPTASNPTPINVQCAADVPAVDMAVVTDAADNCSTPMVAFVSEVSDGNSNPEIITRTYSVTDLAGNSINVSQQITIQDTTNPTATIPAPVTVQCAADLSAVDVNVVTDAADNCSTPVVAFVLEVSDGNSNPEIITRTYSVTDLAGNSINVSQQITIQDTTNPTASNPTPINVQCIADVPAVDVNVVADAADNCSTPVVAFVSEVSDENANPEIITRTYSVTDLAGNTINVSQLISIQDTTNPSASNPSPVNVQCSADIPAVNINVVTGVADNCSTPIVAFVSDVSDENSNPEIITRTYSVTDLAGNSINVIQTITIQDTTNPTASNPSPVNVQCSTDIPAVNINVVTDALDNCSTPIVAFVSDVSDENSNPEIITRTYSVTDLAGNSINVIQLITIQDTTNPSASNPSPVNVQCSADIPAVNINVVTGVADNCSTPIVAFVSDVSDENSNPEIITRTYSVTDLAGNSINVIQTITIQDTTNPTASNPSPVNVQCSADIPAVNINVVTDALDNCSTPIVAFVSDVSDENSNPEIITRTYSVTDDSNNSINVIQIITVDDTIAPVANCKPFTVMLDASGSASISPTDINDNSTDNCGISYMSLDITSFDCSNLGSNTVMLSVYDDAGNVSTCSTTVTVIDPAANSSVTIDSDDANNEICLGDTITFTAVSLNSGTTQYYEWFINGNSEGVTTSATFTPTTTPTDDFTFYVLMTSNISACSPKQSNVLNIIVHPLPVISAPVQICVDGSDNLTPNSGGTWISNNPAVATVSSSGVVTSVSPGNVTFTFTSATTGCSNTTDPVIINAQPTIGNYPSNNDICVDEIYSGLTPNTGGTWSSSNPTVATISNTGVITGINPGNVNFTFTNTATGCSSTSTAIEVLVIPNITSVTALPTTVCAGEPSILSANVQGAGANNRTIVNYNFNETDPTSYADFGGQEAPGVTSFIFDLGNMPFRKAIGVATDGSAFTQNPVAGGAVKQRDDEGNNDAGEWAFDISGISSYKNLSVYFQAKRNSARGNDKYIYIWYYANGDWHHHVNLTLANNTNNWQEFTFDLPVDTDNVDNIIIEVSVNDGYSGTDIDRPDVRIDNFQLKGSTVGDPYLYSWTADTGANAGLPSGAEIPSLSNEVITVNPTETTTYTLTVTNGASGCSDTETTTVEVRPSPEIFINANYCPTDIPSTAQDESNMVQLTATSNLPIDTWTWLTNPVQYGNIIYVDIADVYQVIGVTPDGCPVSASISVAQELVVNGDFSQGNVGFNTDYTYREDVPGLVPANQGELYDDSIGAGYVNGYSITTNGNNVHTNFHGPDHTTGTENFMAVNGHGTQYVVWSQTVNVEAGSIYYFSAWARSLNTAGPFGKLRFRVNGEQVGSQLNLQSYPTKDWDRFYGNWPASGPSTITGPILIEIINNENSFGGNDFGIDDISFATLSTFITLVSDVGSDAQTLCQNAEIDEIIYNVGGGLEPPTTTGLPPGLSTSFNGLSYAITGTPTQAGTFNYSIDTNASCGSKTAVGTIIVNEAPVVTINTAAETVCASNGSIPLNATLSGSASGGTWSVGGTNLATTITGNVATANYSIGSTTGSVLFTFTSNTPTPECGSAVKTVEIEITPFIVASVTAIPTTANCAARTVTLTGNNVAGQWTATPNTGYFSDASLYNSSFTGESGQTYNLIWTATNSGLCANTTASLNVTIPDCGANLVFDGTDDHISFGDHYAMSSGAFSIEAWVKADNFTGTKTIISKRNGSSLTSGYDLSLVDNNLKFRYNNKTIFANQNMTHSKWYHVAVTFDGSNYQMYIDGFEVRAAVAGVAPASNSNKALIGAMDRSGNSPTNYFKGGIDEVRIWNTALSIAQIREMMNQEIKENGSHVMGEVIPINITGNLQWSNLIGYYQMNSGPQTLVTAGTVKDVSNSNISGKLNAMTVVQSETAPIPYVSVANSDWDNAATWSSGSVQQIPNSKEENIKPNDLQTWNIVKTTTNVTVNRPANTPTFNKTVVLGLLVDNNRLSITNDQALYVNKYLNIGTNGVLDLEGESQLMQPEGSIVGIGNGNLERDQQGTNNKFNYNYWGSPVSNAGSGSSSNYALGSILYDGINPVTWITGQNAPGTTNPVTLSSRWLYTYSNLSGAYADWRSINQSTNVSAGLGFTMKGSGVGTPGLDLQNYTFRGTPNNGTITMPISANNETLLGNPYPSAIDADLFINDNESALLNGALIFWEQKPTSSSHNLAQYEGKYSYYTKSGGLQSTVPPGIFGNGGVSKVPRRNLPVAQGFFVTANGTGGTIVFKNSQRVFVKEGASSVFFRGNEDQTMNPDTSDYGAEDIIQRVRLGVKTPEGALRHLLLAFTPDNAATDAVDYGYDALNSDDFPSDAAFLIDGNNYVIQGVGAFEDTKQYPFSINLGIAGPVEFSITDFENFDTDINTYIYDSVLGTYHAINNTSFVIHLEAGIYNQRFYLTFSEDQTLSTIDNEFKDITVKYLQGTNEIYIKTPYSINVKQVYLINIAGQVVKAWNSTNTSISHEMRIPVKDISEGNYIIKIQTDTSSFNKKIIVKATN